MIESPWANATLVVPGLHGVNVVWVPGELLEVWYFLSFVELGLDLLVECMEGILGIFNVLGQLEADLLEVIQKDTLFLCWELAQVQVELVIGVVI